MDNLEIKVEPYSEADAKADLEGLEDQFKDKISDGVGEPIEEAIVDPDEEEELSWA